MPVYYDRTYPFAERTKAKGEEVRQELDAVAAGLVQVDTDVKRALKLPSGFDVELEGNDDLRAGKVLGFDSEGNPVLQQGVGRWRGNYAVATDYAERDIFKDSDGALGLNNIYIVIEAFTSADLTTETAKIDILFDASDAQDFVTAAEAAQVAAEAAQTAAAASASSASTSAATATTQAGTATTQATNASASATQAENAKTYAQEWANKDEDSLISSSAGGNGADDYSARHWSIKSQDSADAAEVSAVNAAASAAAVENERLNWIEGGYQPAYPYQVNDAFSSGGSSYVVIAPVTGVAPPDNSYYDLLAAQGAPGPGTGDMVAANNLSDVASASSSRSNLGISATNTPFDNSGTPLSATDVKTAIAESITRLGTAATENKQTAVTDSTAGRLLIVGAMASLLGFDNTDTGLSATTVQAALAELAGDYTAADVLTKLLTVDGAASGLDADLLDGQHGAYYLAADAYTAADVLTKLLTVDGAGTTLDADLLDGQHGSFYQNASNLNAGTVPSARLPSPATGYLGVFTYAIGSSGSTYSVGSAQSGASLGLSTGTWRVMGAFVASGNKYLCVRIS